MRTSMVKVGLFALCLAACGETTDDPSISSKSNWVKCATDAKCQDYAATCGSSGYCEDEDGERIDRDDEPAMTSEPEAEETEPEPAAEEAEPEPAAVEPEDAGSEATDDDAPQEPSDGYQPISPESTPELFEGETSILGDWVKVTDLPYGAFLRIDGADGFSCNNDGKSVSAAVEFVLDAEAVYMRSSLGQGGEGFVLERVSMNPSSGVLTLEGVEKGVTYTFDFERGERPDICQRVEDGEDVTFEEFEASWL